MVLEQGTLQLICDQRPMTVTTIHVVLILSPPPINVDKSYPLSLSSYNTPHIIAGAGRIERQRLDVLRVACEMFQ